MEVVEGLVLRPWSEALELHDACPLSIDDFGPTHSSRRVEGQIAGSGWIVPNPDITPFSGYVRVGGQSPISPSLPQTWRYAGFILMTAPFDASCAAQRVGRRRRRGRVALLLAKRQGSVALADTFQSQHHS